MQAALGLGEAAPAAGALILARISLWTIYQPGLVKAPSPVSSPPIAADAAVAAFAARLKDAVDLDSVQEDLTRVVHQTLEPAHSSVWISRPD